VLGQVRKALSLAEQAGSTGPVLTNIFSRAIRLGRAARNHTALGRIGRSIGTIAGEYLHNRFGSLAGREVLIVGAGEIARDAALACRKFDARMTVVSRSITSATLVADEVGGRAHTLDALGDELARVEMAIVAVSGDLAIGQSHLPRGEGRPLLILDLSVPRVVDAPISGRVEVLDLEEIPGPRGPEITEAMIDAEALVQKEVADLLHWADTRSAGPAIKELRNFAEQVVQDEVKRVAGSMTLSEDQTAKLQALGLRIANKLLHGPTIELRRCSEADRATIRRAFRLNGE
jgi:glutamyl-tRNA reductase